jgi:hypothetical protein
MAILAFNSGLQPIRHATVERMALLSHCVLIATVAMGLMFERSLNALRRGNTVRGAWHAWDLCYAIRCPHSMLALAARSHILRYACLPISHFKHPISHLYCPVLHVRPAG